MSIPVNIIGYIHICQTGEWKRSFKMLIDSIKKYNLYENTQVIRLGIVNDLGILIEDEILNDPKFQIIYVGKSYEYERPTLLDMREKSECDNNNTIYYYLHTKGIKHFGTLSELCVIDWINLMLYWNIELWQLAVEKIHIHDTYGCNDVGGYHYSGNFWWARKSHIIKLPKIINNNYTDPENWVKSIRNNSFCVYNSGYEGYGHYNNRYRRELYVKT